MIERRETCHIVELTGMDMDMNELYCGSGALGNAECEWQRVFAKY